MKNFSSIVIILSIMIFGISLPLSAHAEEHISVENDIKYYYFSEPYSIAAGPNGIAVLNDNKIYHFNTSNDYEYDETAPADCSEILYNGESLFARASDGIYKENLKIIDGNFSNMYISNNMIFLTEGSRIYSYSVENPDSSPASEYDIADLLLSRYYEIESIAVKDTSIWFSLAGNINRNFSDIYMMDTLTKKISKVYMQQEKILSLDYGESLISYTNRGIKYYCEYSDELKELLTIPYDTLLSICYYNGNVYTLDLLGAVKSFDNDGNGKTLIASASEEYGFYNMPVSVFTKNQSIIVSDFFNNRIAILNDSGTQYIQNIFRPIGAIIDNDGNYYVAQNINTLSVYDSKYNFKSEIILPARIKNIAVDSFNNIYVISGGELYTITQGKAQKVDLTDEVVNIYCNSDNGKVYISDSKKIMLLLNGSDGISTETIAKISAENFAVDDEEQLFILNGDSIDRYSDKEKVADYTIDKGSSYIYISTIKNSYINYGDMLIVNSMTHSINKIPYSEIMTKVVANTYTEPDINSSEPIQSLSTPIIRKLSKDTIMYKSPFDSEILKKLKSGQRIIVDYANSTECYSFVIVSNSMSFDYGYVYTEAISPLTYEYTAAPFDKAVIYNNNTPIYKYPTVVSPILKKLQKDDSVSVMDFAAIGNDNSISEGYFWDDRNYKWYRIDMGDGKEGFILSSDLSLNNYKPDLYPQENGTIIEYKNNTDAPLFSYDSDKKEYIPLGESIKAGTRIEILDLPFDPTVRYCRILYHKDGFGTLECYVLSDYVRYDSKNFAQYIALIIILSCVLLGSLIILLIKYNRKRRKLK